MSTLHLSTVEFAVLRSELADLQSSAVRQADTLDIKGTSRAVVDLLRHRAGIIAGILERMKGFTP